MFKNREYSSSVEQNEKPHKKPHSGLLTGIVIERTSWQLRLKDSKNQLLHKHR